MHHIKKNLKIEKENELGQKIKKFRMEKNITQEKLAEIIDVHFTYIGRIERGEKTPSLKTLKKITQALNISSDLLIETNSEKNEEMKLLSILLQSRSSEEIRKLRKIAEILFFN
ncbi:MAG: helix-turn-helix transcriptional regulator [Candidatus Muirbacterium halophilum]|nr:helix-turn-helix transcriptional regulator [Candidatus Muirbacterium halophilum]MCK9474980.1 helix-turn-helix transcriptional regulator [Candidatus Muirbacterium halophilum]